MSTVKSNTTSERFAKLARLSEMVFHIQDLANLWEITDKNTLHTTLKRYVQKGLLYRIYRGLYSLKPISEINPLLLGQKALQGYCYVSTETILSEAGIINQIPRVITYISDKNRHFSIGDNQYYSRQLKDLFLFNPEGINESSRIRTATIERAVADMLYFNPFYYFDNEKMIHWEKVKYIQTSVGYKN